MNTKSKSDQWKKRITKDIQRRQIQKAKKQQQRNNRTKKKYGKVKNWRAINLYGLRSYEEVERLTSNFRKLPKAFIYSNDLSKEAKAIYPVLACNADFRQNKSFQLSLKNIGRMAGIKSHALIRDAIDELEGSDYVKKQFIIEDRRYYIYECNFQRSSVPEKKQNTEDVIYFYKCIIDTGIWADLSPRQKLFYLGLRAEAKIDPDYDEKIRSLLGDYDYYIDEAYKEYYRKREYDYWVGSARKLCDRIGISSVNLRNTVTAPLEWNGLSKQKPSNYWSAHEVYLIPKSIYEWKEKLKEKWKEKLYSL